MNLADPQTIGTLMVTGVIVFVIALYIRNVIVEGRARAKRAKLSR